MPTGGGASLPGSSAGACGAAAGSEPGADAVPCGLVCSGCCRPPGGAPAVWETGCCCPAGGGMYPDADAGPQNHRPGDGTFPAADVGSQNHRPGDGTFPAADAGSRNHRPGSGWYFAKAHAVFQRSAPVPGNPKGPGYGTLSCAAGRSPGGVVGTAAPFFWSWGHRSPPWAEVTACAPASAAHR